MKKYPILILFLCFISTSTSFAFQTSPSSESDRLNTWFEDKFEEELQMSPIRLTMMGRKDRYSEFDDASIEAEREMLSWRAETIEEMKSTFDYDKLDLITKMSYDLWIYEYEHAKEALTFTEYNYIFTQMQGIHGQLPNVMINFHRVENASDMSDYISRIEGLSQTMNQLIERSKAQAELGIRPPKFSYEIVISESEALISGVPFNESDDPAPIWADVQTKLNTLTETEAIDARQAEVFENQARRALVEHFKPAYENLIEWLSEDIENAELAPTGVSSLTNGEAFYNFKLKEATTTNLTADEVHNIGLSEVSRIHSEMEAIKEQVGFDGTLQEYFQFTDKDAQFFYENTDEGREAYLEACRVFLGEIEKKLPDYFGILPKAGLVVKRVESFREQDGAPQHYYPGTPDGSRDGIFYAHLSDMKSMPKPPMEAIAYHEGNPGHHMQISIAQELTSVPTFRTQNFQTAYVEGWALYSELLSKEMGQYKDPYSDFGRLSTELWRAIRLVVDTGLHSKGWTEAQAIAYFKENSPVSEGAIRAEVRRYMVWPGQATSYKIGMLKILELRAHSKAELGDKFDIKEFHDTILGNGSLPLELLEKLVDQWIDTKKAG